jgi:hypothetical protein
VARLADALRKLRVDELVAEDRRGVREPDKRDSDGGRKRRNADQDEGGRRC